MLEATEELVVLDPVDDGSVADALHAGCVASAITQLAADDVLFAHQLPWTKQRYPEGLDLWLLEPCRTCRVTRLDRNVATLCRLPSRSSRLPLGLKELQKLLLVFLRAFLGWQSYLPCNLKLPMLDQVYSVAEIALSVDNLVPDEDSLLEAVPHLGEVGVGVLGEERDALAELDEFA